MKLLRKTVLGIMLTSLLMSMLTLAFNIQPVRAGGTIYIRADGSVDPPSAPISTLDNVTYTLTDNINDSIVVERDNIVVEGMAHTIQGPEKGIESGVGVDLSYRNNVGIKNATIRGFYIGIRLEHSLNNNVFGNNITNNIDGVSLRYSLSNNIFGNNITNNYWDGIDVDYSSNYNGIFRNNITNNWHGLWLLRSSDHNDIFRNNLMENDYGISLYESSSNNISGNNITNNKRSGIELHSKCSNNSISENMLNNNGLFVYDSYGNIVGDNYVNNKPLIYLENVSHYYVDGASQVIGQLILVNCNAIRVENLNLYNASISLNLWKTISCEITNNNITTNNCAGIWLGESSNITIYKNNIINNWCGVELVKSSSNTILGNDITNNQGGIFLHERSNNNTIRINNITNNDCGIRIDDSRSNNISGNNITNNTESGIYLYWSSLYNIIFGNNIAYNEDGIWIDELSHANTIYGNNITENNECGVNIRNSNDNVFYHNNFINNTRQAWTGNTPNIWNIDYPSGGNYWSDYNGTDLLSGPSQDQLGSDGIGDMPYVIPKYDQDRYPLMGPFNTFDAGTWNGVAYNVDVVSNSTTSGFYFNPNEGLFLKFNVTGVEGTWGFCRVAIPKRLLWADKGRWVIFVGREEVNYTLTLDEINSYLFFTYQHSTKPVIIQGTDTAITFYNLTITSTEGGTTNPEPGIYTYVNGTLVNVAAIPNLGYSFDHWLFDGNIRAENPITITMDTNHTLQAIFIDDISPEIGTPTQEPQPDNVQPYQNVTVTVNVTDLGTGVYNVTLWYSLDNGTTWIPLNMAEIFTNNYQATIRGYENCTWVTYKIIAYDNAENNATKDNNGYYYKYHIIPEFPSTIILPVFMLTTLIATILLKKKRKPKPQLP